MASVGCPSPSRGAAGTHHLPPAQQSQEEHRHLLPRPLRSLKLFAASRQDNPLDSSCPRFPKAVILPDSPENKRSRLGAGIPSDVPEMPPSGTSRSPPAAPSLQ